MSFEGERSSSVGIALGVHETETGRDYARFRVFVAFVVGPTRELVCSNPEQTQKFPPSSQMTTNDDSREWQIKEPVQLIT